MSPNSYSDHINVTKVPKTINVTQVTSETKVTKVQILAVWVKPVGRVG